MRWGKTESLSLTEKLSRENKFIVKKKKSQIKISESCAGSRE